MHLKSRIFAIIAGLGLALMGAFHAKAVPIGHTFSVTATSGPLAGVTENGTFTYDSSIILPNGLINGVSLTHLNFTWNSVTYNETTANTGYLIFDAVGNLLWITFGPACPALGGCQITYFTNSWWITSGVDGVTGNFVYATPEIDVAKGTAEVFSITTTNIPEPSSLALFSVAGLMLVCAARRWLAAAPIR